MTLAVAVVGAEPANRLASGISTGKRYPTRRRLIAPRRP